MKKRTLLENILAGGRWLGTSLLLGFPLQALDEGTGEQMQWAEVDYGGARFLVGCYREKTAPGWRRLWAR